MAAPVKHAPSETGTRVLIVDDTPDLRTLMRLVLETSGGFDVVGEATNGEEAIELTSRYLPDVAVVDVAMPVMGGLEAIPEMRRRHPDVRIAVLTVLDVTDLRARALAAGADVCLDKALAPDELVAELARLAGVGDLPPATGEGQPADAAWETQALRETVAGFNQAFDEAAIGMAFTDLDGRPLRVNRSLCRILGTGPKEATERPLWGDPEAGRVGPAPSWERDGAGVDGDVREWRRADGSATWVELHATPVRDPGGQPLYLFCQVKDVTARRRVEQALRDSEARSRTLLASLDEGVVLLDRDLTVVTANESAGRILGYPVTELLGGRADSQTPWFDEDGNELARERSPLFLALRGGDVQRGTVGITVRGQRRWLALTVSPLGADADPPGGLVVSFADVTETRAAALALAESERRFRILAANSTDMITVHDAGFRTVYVSPASRQLVAYEPEEVAELGADLVHPDDLDQLASVMADNTRETGTLEMRAIAKDGREVWLETHFRRIRDDEGRLLEVQTASRDITVRKELEARLTDMAMHDALTGLANRVLLIDRLEHALARRQAPGTGLAVLFVDLDRFKLVNDTYGHAAGDQVLRTVASRLRDVLRPADTAARLGGDEFIVVCEDLSGEEEATVVAGRILDALAEPHEVGGESIVVTASVGIVVAEHNVPAEALVRMADTAMYGAKQAGRARWELFG